MPRPDDQSSPPADGAPRLTPQQRFRRLAWLRIIALLLAALLGALLSPQLPAAEPTMPRVVALQGHLELDYSIRVSVEDLSAWAADNDVRSLVPFIDGRALAGNGPESIDLGNGQLVFHLRISEDSRSVWTDLLGSPEGLRRPVTFSVGPVDGSPFPSVHDEHHRVPLTVISPVYGGIALALVVFTLLAFVHLARSTSIIRKPAAQGLGPYDLGRFQMAVWFFLIYLSYTAIWLVTDATDTINASLLALLGISAGTALSEAVIESGAAPAADETDAPPPAEGMRWPSGPLPAGQSRSRLHAARRRLLQDDPAHSADASQGLLNDLLSDATGYRFDRFQIFAFTLILGVIFLSDVYNNLSMPELSPTLLGLMGLSSGTYIGFKLPERR
ncbi:hypothetical protein [Stenotrophomonas sp.]|uniref:hypothetical protein n=1 Tax=Stenotrophomonas sp. TaxID=69392 RepID=UPI0028A7C600|nr:hypothetical protein [Stenotrophomonas sp.]